ncbi:MAG: TlpA disulfide reductase family protein [Bacteroidota bacterium]
MKHNLIILMLFLFSILTASARKRDNVDEVLRKTSETINNLKTISYDSYREINNIKDNYFAKNSGSSYFEYNQKLEGKISKFQLQSENALQIYNGTEYFSLNKKNKTYELEKVSELANLSLFYNSITTLRIALPLILEDKSVSKSLKDTLINDTNYHLIKFELKNKMIDFPMGFLNFDVQVTRYYQLIIDKNTYFPKIILERNSLLKDQYYTRTSFTNINTAPKALSESSWYYSSYVDYESKKKVVQKPIIPVGSILLDWSLPKYGNQISDTVKSANHQGKIVLMEFWIKNCGYCMLAFPEVKELQKKYGHQIEILSINAYDKKEDLDFFYRREKPAYKMLYDGEKMANELGIYAYPATVLIDQSGKVIYAARGFDKKKTDEAIQTVLK